MVLLLNRLLLCFFLLNIFLFLLLERLLSLDLLHQTGDKVVLLPDFFSGFVEFVTSMHAFLSVPGKIGKVLIF